MKIEKLNDNQIRCTLTRDDLASRQLKLSELAYGTDKAKSLFHDMMKQAADEVGFMAEDAPLMIEAIPAGSGSIVLIITKVDDPEELDTRFSKFAPSNEQTDNVPRPYSKLEGADDLLDLLNSAKSAMEEAVVEVTPVHLFTFSSLDSVIHASHFLDDIYDGLNTLYKDNIQDIYILLLTPSPKHEVEFPSICNMLSEYGSLEKATGVTLAYIEEHCSVIIAKNAVQQLTQFKS